MKNTYDLVDSLGGLPLCVWVPAPLTTPLVHGDRKTEAARSIIQQGVNGVERLTGAAIKDFRVWQKDDSVSVIKFSVNKDKEAAFRQTTAEWLETYIPGARLIGPKWYPVKADWIEVGLAMDTDSGKVSRSAMERNESCIGFCGLIPGQIFRRSGWYSSVKAHQHCIYTANREALHIALSCACEAYTTSQKIYLISVYLVVK